MKALRQLGFLILSHRSGQAAGHVEDGRVLTLFRKRAELKKAYGGLQEEVYRLKERIRQQENATQRVQEMLAALESRLSVADSAYPALVFYQLRGLWQLGHDLIRRLVEDLARQHEEHERRAYIAEYNSRRFARKQNVQASLREAERQLAEARMRLDQLERQRSELRMLWHYFRRRGLERQIHAAVAKVSAADAVLAEARLAVEELDSEAVPGFPGLSLETRRAINLTAIAYAEILCQRLANTPLVNLAREAAARRHAGGEYQSRDKCEAIINEIARARALLEAHAGNGQEVRARAERLKQVARYRHSADTTPVAESIVSRESNGGRGGKLPVRAAARMPNVLDEDIWDLFRVLLR